MPIDPATGYSPDANWTLIPTHMHAPLTRYLTWGEPTGAFLTALLSNDLMGAARRADVDNLTALGGWAAFLDQYVHPPAYGSPDKVRAWVEAGGAYGREHPGAAT